MPFLLVLGLVSAAIGAYTMVQGVKNNNKQQVMMGMLGIFGGVASAGGAFASAAGAAGAGTGAAVEGASVAGQFAAPVSSVSNTTSTFAAGGGLTGLGSEATAVGEVGGAGAGSANPFTSTPAATAGEAASAFESVGGTGTAVDGLTQLGGAVNKSSAGLGTKLGDTFKSGLSFLKDNPEMTKLGSSLFKSVMDKGTADDNRKAMMDYEKEKQRRIDIENDRRGYHAATPTFRGAS